MFFLIRLGLFLASIAVVGGFVVEHFPSIRTRVIELVNPVAQQDSLFAQLNSILDELNTTTINIKNSHSPAELQLATIKQEQAIVATKALIQKIQQNAKGNTSLIDQGVSKAVDLIFGTPVPSSLQSSNTNILNTADPNSATNPQITTTSISAAAIQQALSLISGSSPAPTPSPSPICPTPTP